VWDGGFNHCVEVYNLKPSVKTAHLQVGGEESHKCMRPRIAQPLHSIPASLNSIPRFLLQVARKPLLLPRQAQRAAVVQEVVND
jgi:hypothetical protein